MCPSWLGRRKIRGRQFTGDETTHKVNQPMIGSLKQPLIHCVMLMIRVKTANTRTQLECMDMHGLFKSFIHTYPYFSSQCMPVPVAPPANALVDTFRCLHLAFTVVASLGLRTVQLHGTNPKLNGSQWPNGTGRTWIEIQMARQQRRTSEIEQRMSALGDSQEVDLWPIKWSNSTKFYPSIRNIHCWGAPCKFHPKMTT